MKKIIVLISGNGSNLQALIDANLRAEISLVVSNRKEAYGLKRAEQANIPTLYFPLKPYKDRGQSREAYDADLAQTLLPYQPDLIVLAGWMHILSSAFLKRFPNKVINLHPALPGQFDGTQAIERAYAAFQQGQIEQTGIMVHYVIPAVDAGPVLATATVPIYAADQLADLENRIHAAEHRLLVETVAKLLA